MQTELSAYARTQTLLSFLTNISLEGSGYENEITVKYSYRLKKILIARRDGNVNVNYLYYFWRFIGTEIAILHRHIICVAVHRLVGGP